MKKILLVLLSVGLATSTGASHLTEAEVIEMEERCEKLRQQKLAPEKAAVLQNCLAEGKDRSACEAEAGDYGETRTGAIFRPGKYLDLPECQEAYRARKHFNINPG